MIRDLRYAARTLARSPGFATIAILTLALGIGLASTIFSAVNALLIKPLPLMRDQNRLVVVEHYLKKVNEKEDVGFDYPMFLDARKHLTTIEGTSGSQDTTMIITGTGKPDRYLGAAIQADAFQMLGVTPLLGRWFRLEENEASAEPVVLLGHDLWQKRYAGNPAVVGKTIEVNGMMATIIGVMPQGWRYPHDADLWMPLRFDEKKESRGQFFLNPVARLKPGVTLAQANAELAQFAEMETREHPDVNKGSTFQVVPLREAYTRDARTLTLLLMGAVLFVHLIACANVANLLLARGATRTKEFGIRLALGANRRRVVRQLLIESALIGVAGAAGGLVIAVWGIDLMTSMISVPLPFWLHFDLDFRVFSFAVITGIISGVLFGLLPALRVSRPNLAEVLKEGGRTALGGSRGQRIRDWLVVAEVAVALVLLIGAGLMMRSFVKLQQMDTGIEAKNVLTFRVGLPKPQYKDEKVVRRFFDQVIPRLEAIPGVESAGAISALPVSGNGVGAFILEGEEYPKALQDARISGMQIITPGYFRAMAIPFRRGRDFSSADDISKPLVAIIDESAAHTLFPNQNAIGKRICKLAVPPEKPKWFEVVGVVRDVVYNRPTAKRTLPTMYFNEAQETEAFMSVAVRTQNAPASFTNAVRNAVLSVNKDIPIYKVKLMTDVVKESFWERGFFGTLFTAFGVIALFLASIGLYGVMSYAVRQRTQEIGIRIALGAQARDVLAMVTRDGLRLIGVGLVIGLVSAYFVVQLLRDNLAQVSAHDPFSFTILPLILVCVGMAACYFPARSATHLDPVEALRYE
jgi:putative ABC transport system permease protein